MKASLVYDGRGCPSVPEEMGKPKEGQLQGTPCEQLTEIAGRVCYDSLGKGRSSAEFHQHILEVGHLSVHEHFHFTVSTELSLGPNDYGAIRPAPLLYIYQAIANRPGLYVMPFGHRGLRITVDMRTVLEWSRYTDRFVPKDSNQEIVARSLGDALENIACQLCPMVIKPKRPVCSQVVDIGFGMKMPITTVDPEDEGEKWITLYLSGSRGFSHEQVRHGDESAISQRSTRYVDENKAPWEMHPLNVMYMARKKNEALLKKQQDLIALAREVYAETTDELQKWMIELGAEKFSARKQARGAARGFLGNALMTELIFSASVSQWKHMLRQRCSAPADAEIRQIFVDVLTACKRTQYYDSFKDMETVACPDGIGKCLKE